MGRYEEAIEAFKELDDRSRKGECPTWWPRLSLSQVYAELDREEEARAYMAEGLKLNPDFSLEFIKKSSLFKNPAHLQRVLDTYRKAGMPEKPPGAVQ